MARSPRLFDLFEGGKKEDKKEAAPKAGSAKPFGPPKKAAPEKPEKPKESSLSGGKVDYAAIGGKPADKNCTLCGFYSDNSCSVTNVVYTDASQQYCPAFKSSSVADDLAAAKPEVELELVA